MKLTWLAFGGLVVAASFGLGIYLFFSPKTSPTNLSGKITGFTLYPSEFNPAQTVCAELVADSNLKFCQNIAEQEGTEPPQFSLTVPAGEYYVYSFLTNPADLGLNEARRAYWTEFVQCGLKAECPSHQRLVVKVKSGQTIMEIKPHDWYE